MQVNFPPQKIQGRFFDLIEIPFFCTEFTNRDEREGNDGGIGGQMRQSTRPRISGPPLRKQSSASSGGGINLASSLASLSTSLIGTSTGSGSGICPPGNTPTTDPSTGQVLLCNGMTPKCPPKSYCFVTGKLYKKGTSMQFFYSTLFLGEASETYNCCKSY